MTNGEMRALLLKGEYNKNKMVTFTVPEILYEKVKALSVENTATHNIIVAMFEYMENKSRSDINLTDGEIKHVVQWQLADKKRAYSVRLPITLLDEFKEYYPAKTTTEKYNVALWEFVLRRQEK